jgi:small RNA 2'-O-methyltransferase
MTTWLHEQRLEGVHTVVRTCGARSVLDLGCGDGDMLVRLAVDPRIEQIVGVDICGDSLGRLRNRLSTLDRNATTDVDLVQASIVETGARFGGFDCAILIETIEHIDPDRLTMLERAVFAGMRPATIVITTPNAEFNSLLGVPADRFRHPDHRFEWDRTRFRRWATGVAARNRYDTTLRDLAGWHPKLGGASQMAVFESRR